MIRLLVDGVFFQLNNTGIARVWRTVLTLLAEEGRFEIYALDRGRFPNIDGVKLIPFQPFDPEKCALDSLRIQEICDSHKVDVFTSTYYTTPINTAMLLMVYDMIPELFNFNLKERIWMEKDVAISYAQRYICISENTRRDLLAMYPEIPSEITSVAYCGVDESVFFRRGSAAIDSFRKRYGLNRPYFLFVGSRVQHNGYKNSQIFFDALAGLDLTNFDVFCVGGERDIEQSILEQLPKGVRCQREVLDDDELATAYGGALALVYPSLYEGFGMPVIEAMASGCPVITTRHGSLAEAAGDAAMLISGESISEMRDALMRIQDSAFRDILRDKGLEHVQRFTWHRMVSQISSDLEMVAREAGSGMFDDFFSEWRRLRIIQSGIEG